MALEASGLAKAYGEVVAVEAFDVEVPPGTVLGFLGPNGAGKTTVMRMLSTVLRPDAGSFVIGGIPGSEASRVRRVIGVLPESAGYPPAQTGAEWLAFHARLFGQSRESAWATSRRLLGEVGLGGRAGSLISSYSRGMFQRLGVARALVNDPSLVLLDEPTLGLDPAGQRQLLQLVSDIAQDRSTTVVVSTHQIDDVEHACDAVLVMHHGRVVAHGTVADVARRVAAPRRALLTVPPADVPQCLDVLGVDSVPTTVKGSDRQGDLRLMLSGGVDVDDASAAVLRAVLEAGIPVRGFVVEAGRLTEAFLSLTGAAP